MSAIQGCLIIEVNGRTVGTFRIVHYIMGVRFSGVSVKRGSTVVIVYILSQMEVLSIGICIYRS